MKENQNVEWKESWRDEYLKWICGFANAQGGKLYIGCDDNGNVVGVEDSSKLLVDVPNKIRNFMSVVADVNLLMQGDKEYIEIYVLHILWQYLTREYTTTAVEVLCRHYLGRSLKALFLGKEEHLGTICLCQVFQ